MVIEQKENKKTKKETKKKQMEIAKIKEMIYHLSCVFEIMKESGMDMGEYKKEIGILEAMKGMSDIATKLEALINDPTEKVG